MWHTISIGVGTGGQEPPKYGKILYYFRLFTIINNSLQPPNQRELPTSMISTCLIILHNLPAMCYRICRPILYPPFITTQTLKIRLCALVEQLYVHQ